MGIRRALSWIFALAAVAVVVVSLVQGFTAGPEQSTGWGEGVVQAVLGGVPLAAVALGLRSGRREVARRMAVLALVFAGVAAFVLVMQVLDANETTADRLLQAGVMLLFAAAAAVEWPAFTGHWRG